jgi:hypothetical protein
MALDRESANRHSNLRVGTITARDHHMTGLNDVLNMPVIDGFCGTCHDTLNVGNHSVKALFNIGTANAGHDAPLALDISRLPVFTLECFAGPLRGSKFVVTDPGRAMITGKCADIGSESERDAIARYLSEL